MTTETAPALNLKTDLFINGEFGPAATGKRFATVNPATGDTLAEVSGAPPPAPDRSAPAAPGKRFPPVNPATGDTLAEVSEASAPDLDRAVAAARQAYETGPWAAMKPRQRGRILMRAAELLLARAD